MSKITIQITAEIDGDPRRGGQVDVPALAGDLARMAQAVEALKRRDFKAVVTVDDKRPTGFIRVRTGEEGTAIQDGDMLDCDTGICVVLASGHYKDDALIRIQTISPKKSLPAVGASLTWKNPRAGCALRCQYVGDEP